MVAIPPTPLDALRVHGIATAIPDRRTMPGVASAVLLDPKRARVYFPPFTLRNGLLCEVGDALSPREFDELVERELATALPGAPARGDGCFYFPAGGGPAEYTSLTSAASRLAEFAEIKVARGDRFLRDGKQGQALAEYELAAATSQAPDHLARMLLLELPARRKRRIVEALARVATLPSPDDHVKLARTKFAMLRWKTTGHRFNLPMRSSDRLSRRDALRPMKSERRRQNPVRDGRAG